MLPGGGRNGGLQQSKGPGGLSSSVNQPIFAGSDKQSTFKRQGNPQVIQNLQGGNTAASGSSKEIYQVYLNNF